MINRCQTTSVNFLINGSIGVEVCGMIVARREIMGVAVDIRFVGKARHIRILSARPA
jgi:hypothetical protein